MILESLNRGMTEQLTNIDSIVVECQCAGSVVGRIEISQQGVGNWITGSLQTNMTGKLKVATVVMLNTLRVVQPNSYMKSYNNTHACMYLSNSQRDSKQYKLPEHHSKAGE